MATSRKNVPPVTTNFEFYDSNPNNRDRFDPLSIKSLLSTPMTAIADQTSFIRRQIKQINSQLSLLDSLTKKLLDENGLLRKHLQKKTHDISKIITTIQTNSNQEIQDYKQMIHLCRESNNILMKKTEQAHQYKKRLSQKSSELKASIRDLSEQTIQKQNQHYNALKAKIENNYSTAKIKELQKEQKAFQKEQKQLIQQIQDLTFDILELIKGNKTAVRDFQDNDSDNKLNSTKFKNNIVHLLKNQQQLKDQIQSYKQTSVRQTKQNQELEKVKENKYAEIKQIIRKNQKKIVQMTELEEKLKQLKDEIAKCEKVNDNYSIVLYTKKSQNEKLVSELAYLKKSFINKTFQNEKDNLIKNHTKQLFKIKQKQIELERISNSQVQKMKRMKQVNEEQIKGLKEELKELQQDYQSFNETLKTLDDPTDEIQRLLIEKKYQRQPLSDRN